MLNSFQDIQIAINRLKKSLHCKQKCIEKITTTEKLAIVNPYESQLVYDITLHQLSYFNNTVWVNI